MSRPSARRLRQLSIDAGPEKWRFAILALLAFAPELLRLGWPGERRILHPDWVHVSQAILLVGYAVAMAADLLRLPPDERGPAARGRMFEIVAIAAAIIFFWWWPAVAIAAALLAAYHLTLIYNRIAASAVSPAVLFVVTFLALIVAGAALLKTPAATPAGKPISLLDAMFTSTSAVCVTGLIVRDTATEFTRFGHIVILVLIQLGGLGMVFFGALLTMFLGGDLGLRGSRVFASSGEASGGPRALQRLIAFIAAAVFTFEAIGAAALYFGLPETWTGAPDMQRPGDRLFHSVFFSVSAFCNAGFATTPNSLSGLRGHWTSHLVVAPLIVIGGLGFPVLLNLWRVVVSRIRRRRLDRSGALIRLSLHTKLAVTATVALYLFGLALLTFDRMFEGGQALWPALLDGHFMSISPRTAGFETVPPASFGPLGRFTMIILMFIGGCPGSAAGGVKTIVFSVLAVTVWATIVGNRSARMYRRTISDEVIRKAATLITLGVLSVAVVTGALTATESARRNAARESHEFPPTTEALLFEAVSASSTVGLSLGPTPNLTNEGKAIITAAMFLGRLGPLVVLVAIVSVARRPRPRYEYPEEDVVMS